MTHLVNNIQNQINQACTWAGGAGASINQRVSTGIQRTQGFVAQNGSSLVQVCKNTAEKTGDFIIRNKNTIFFIGSCCVTGYFAPHLFFPIVVATIILRVELARHLRNYANTHLKDSHNPYKLNPRYGPQYISTMDLTMGAIAAVDAFALGTIFLANSWSIALIPVLGGIAAGSTVAKLGMDIAHF